MSACYECHGEGFKHGCCDDMCIGSNEAEDCMKPVNRHVNG